LCTLGCIGVLTRDGVQQPPGERGEGFGFEVEDRRIDQPFRDDRCELLRLERAVAILYITTAEERCVRNVPDHKEKRRESALDLAATVVWMVWMLHQMAGWLDSVPYHRAP
jgi:hypothetical protein